MSVERAVEAALQQHPAIEGTALTGSRAGGSATTYSDWDFRVVTTDFSAVRGDIRTVVEPLNPIAQQWDRLSRHATYMLILEGPTKVDLLFDAPHEPEPPWIVGRATLQTIDDHFWDWTLWLLSKNAAGDDRLVSGELLTMFEHLLRPIGVTRRPEDLRSAVQLYVQARLSLEARYHVVVDRCLQREVSRALREVFGIRAQPDESPT